MTQYEDLKWKEKNEHLPSTLINSTDLYYKDDLSFNTCDLGKGDSLGMLLTLEKEVHWFMNGVWRGSVRVEDYPLDIPIWGVVDVYGLCKQVKAEICTGKLAITSTVYV